MLEELADRRRHAEENCPPVRDSSGRRHYLRGELSVSLEEGVWEVEWCVLDPARNTCLRRDTFAQAVQAVFDHDNEALKAQGR